MIICACGSHATISDSSQSHSPETGNHIVMPEGGERPLLTLESIKEYQELINSGKLPSTFVQHEKISQIGDFKSLVFLSDALAGEYSSYMYNLVDASDYELALYVKHNATNQLTTSSITNVTPENLRLLSEKSSGAYIRDELVYQYVSGELLSITWVNEEITYTMSGTSMLSDYPSTNSTFAGKLLNTDTATTTMNALLDNAKE